MNNPCVEIEYFEGLDHYMTTAGEKLEIGKAMYDIAVQASDFMIEWIKGK